MSSAKSKDKFTIILNHFNFTCRTYTFIMMLKLQLQNYLFTEKNLNKSDINATVHKLTYLETAAALLNDIAVSTCMHMYMHIAMLCST